MINTIVLYRIWSITLGFFGDLKWPLDAIMVFKGKWLWTRTIGSTIVSEGIDSILFVLIAFAGAIPREVLVLIIVSNYLFKTSLEIMFTHLTYQVINFLKSGGGRGLLRL